MPLVVNDSSNKIADSVAIGNHTGDSFTIASNSTDGTEYMCSVPRGAFGVVPRVVGTDAGTFTVGVGVVNGKAGNVRVPDLDPRVNIHSCSCAGIRTGCPTSHGTGSVIASLTDTCGQHD
jgi:hypothetical protein